MSVVRLCDVYCVCIAVSLYCMKCVLCGWEMTIASNLENKIIFNRSTGTQHSESRCKSMNKFIRWTFYNMGEYRGDNTYIIYNNTLHHTTTIKICFYFNRLKSQTFMHSIKWYGMWYDLIECIHVWNGAVYCISYDSAWVWTLLFSTLIS